MAVKVIVCPSCGEIIEIMDLYEGSEISCKFCGCVMIYQEGRLLLLDTNEEFDIEDLEYREETEEEEEEEEEEDYYYFEEE